MAIRVLITGITGFVGSHLAEYAITQGAEVWGSCRWRSKTENIDHMREQLHLVECDLRDLSSVQHLVEQAAPDYIVHLAAQSFVASSWHAPAETLYTNSVSQVNLLEAIRQGKRERRALSRHRIERGVRAGVRGRIADQGDESATAALAVRGQQSHPGLHGLPVLPELSLAHRAHAPSTTRDRGAVTCSSPPTSPGRSPRSKSGSAAP